MQKYNFRQNCIFIVTVFTVKRSDSDQSAIEGWQHSNLNQNSEAIQMFGQIGDQV